MKKRDLAIDLGALLGGPPRDERTEAQKLEDARTAFTKTLDAVAAGQCPHGSTDTEHHEVQTTLEAFLTKAMRRGLLPDPVMDSMVKMLAHVVIHTDHDGGWPGELSMLMEGRVQHFVLLAVGAALRVAGQPETSGIRISTGNYL